MATIPTNPSDGDTFTDGVGVTWTYNSSSNKWLIPVSAAAADEEELVTATDFFIASSATFPTSVHSGTTTNAGSGTLVWSNYPTATTSVSAYAGQATSTTTSTTSDATILHQAGDWIQMSNSITSYSRGSSSYFTVTLNGINVATIIATIPGSGQTSSPGTATQSGGGYITQAMIDAGDGNPVNDTWTYSLSDVGGNSSANGGATIYADSRL
jgi:hypothetical protein